MSNDSIKYEVPYNHWQLSTNNKLFLCPYDGACRGQTYIYPIRMNSSNYFLLHQCSSDFSGLLCSKPSHPYHYIDIATRDSVSCMLFDQINVAYLALPGLVFVFCLYFFGILRYLKKDTYKGERKENDTVVLKPVNYLDVLIALKLLLLNLQIVSQLPVILYSSFPNTTSMILKIFGFLSLSSTLLVPFNCLSEQISLTYHHMMYLSTLFPIFIFFCLSLIFCTLNEIAYLGNPIDIEEVDEESQLKDSHEAFVIEMVEKREQQQFNYFYKLVAVLFFFYDLWIGNLSQLLFGSLFCVQLNFNPSLPQSTFFVLWNDPMVQCYQSDFYSVFTLLWVFALIILFLVLFPLMMFVILFSVSSSLQVHGLRKGRPDLSIISTTGSISKSLELWKTPCRASIFLFEYLFEGMALNGLAKYWNIIETFYRVLMIGLLPILCTQDNRVWKTALALILSVLFLVILAKFRPYRESFQSFMVVSSFLVTCYIFVTLFAQMKVKVMESKSFDIIFSLFLLALPCSFCYHLLFRKMFLEWQRMIPFDRFSSSPLPSPEQSWRTKQSSCIESEEKSNFHPQTDIILRPRFKSKQWEPLEYNEVVEEKAGSESDESVKVDEEYAVKVDGHDENQRDHKNVDPTFDDVFDFSDIYECFDEIEHPLSLYIQLSYRYSMMASSSSQFPPQRREEGISLTEDDSAKA